MLFALAPAFLTMPFGEENNPMLSKCYHGPFFAPDNTNKGLRRQWRNPLIFLKLWRRVWDLNPRGAYHAYTISSRAPSAARTTLHAAEKCGCGSKQSSHIRSKLYQLSSAPSSITGLFFPNIPPAPATAVPPIPSSKKLPKTAQVRLPHMGKCDINKAVAACEPYWQALRRTVCAKETNPKRITSK